MSCKVMLKRTESWCGSVKLDKADTRGVRRYISRISMAKWSGKIKIHTMKQKKFMIQKGRCLENIGKNILWN